MFVRVGKDRRRRRSGCELCAVAVALVPVPFPLSIFDAMFGPVDAPERVGFDPDEGPGRGKIRLRGAASPAESPAARCLRFRLTPVAEWSAAVDDIVAAGACVLETAPGKGDALREDDGEALSNTAWTW